jgi:ubiquinone/menaquinone biosynthesis C-methylase UbiE
MIDKNNLLQNLGSRGPVALDVGCGPLKKDPSWIGIDRLDHAGVDLVGDVFEVLAAFPENSVDTIHASHFFEHLPDLERLVDATGRVLKPGGRMTVITPHFSNPYFYSDCTHRTFFGLYTFSYLADEKLFKRKVPDYGGKREFDLARVDLRFKSPFRIRRWLYQVGGSFFNLSYYLQELYEECFSRVFYCYEIEYTLVKKTSA